MAKFVSKPKASYNSQVENTLKNIQTVAFIFFLILGIGYLVSSLFVLSGNFLPISATVKKTLFFPFIVMSIAYTASSILDGVASEEKNSRMQTVTTIVMAVIIIALIAFVHFGLPDKGVT